MGSNIIELAKLGHERAAELKASCGAVDVRSLAQLISDLATHLEVQLVRGNAQAVQLANAESKCRELAAENAGLKNFIINDCHVAHIEPETFYEEEITRYVSADGYEPETPASDAFLAEVRAQGVDAVRNALIKFVEDEVGTNTNVPGLIRGAEVCVSIAAQLRKGAAL
ncbi:hypothetical protein DTG47_12055 [Salmonella enterica subsp. enterica]|uniref:hypothetical protein n=1 Tax=Salmonella enterica TaxID=28901 RepID=UPI000FB65E85|nr:hypothetical protein [Salmonella enterica]EFR5246712.1 hypothetical protein [Salmonella enterica subsp. enterica serovar Infantis]EAB7141298.1 hypothetical protein [Salmonella enterica subsp. enterica serovar Heidelberg]EAB7744996.1 hypothetical protein [Salmonella enterica subsp. enterica serovar Heidelberg]EBC9745275.1 hypothetical protein [Salmonella enterica subsp. enterica serovar Heidelberg]EBC9792825.1 hypothetical protein [Salmonella enterica subsp. enterica serovar Heidelberg]